MHCANHFAYLVSYHILYKSLPQKELEKDVPKPLLSFYSPEINKFPYQEMEMDLWARGAKTWDQETYIAHFAYRKYIGLANRMFCVFRYRKTYNHQFLESIETNRFYTPAIREKIRGLYFQTHRILGALRRFMRIWTCRRTQIQVSFDLYMTQLVLGHRHTFPLYQSGNLYLFSLHDLTNLVVSSIAHHNVIPYNSGLEHFPKVIKNPYNNVPLTKTDLYNIYFHMKHVFIHVNAMIHRFFMCEFNVYQFAKENRAEIERYGVLTLMKNTQKSTLARKARVMFIKYTTHYSARRSTIKVKHPPIHADFPEDTLVKIMWPYLKLYYLSEYTVNGEQEYGALLKRRMSMLVRYNPQFGQPIYTVHGTDGSKQVVGYYDSTPTRDKTMMYYMETHKYDDAINNRYSLTGDMDSTYDRGYDEIQDNFLMQEWNVEPPRRRARRNADRIHRSGVVSTQVVQPDSEEEEPVIINSSDSELEHADDTFDD